MASYIMEFSVKGPMAYLSHLELMKVFRQGFRRSTLPISFSEGFNPHMKLSFAIAKGVGLESEGELLEIETDTEIDISDFYKRINDVLPEYLRVIEIKLKGTTTKSLSALLKSARYLITGDNILDKKKAIQNKLEAAEILMEIRTKHSQGVKDIKQYIIDWNFQTNGVIIDVYAGSEKNLRIDHLMKYLDMDLNVMRIKLFGENGAIIDNLS